MMVDLVSRLESGGTGLEIAEALSPGCRILTGDVGVWAGED